MSRPGTQPGSERFAVVYECPECDQRYLDERRCPDCNLFCRRLDVGRPCPHCDELAALQKLAAHHPNSPAPQQEAATTY